MSIKERIKRLKDEITAVYEEREQEERACLKLEAEERKKLEAKLDEEKLAEENWHLIKRRVLGTLQELNEGLLDGKGKIVGWQTERTREHDHSTSSYTGQDGYSYNPLFTQAVVERAELRIIDIGKLVVFRTRTFRTKDNKRKEFLDDDRMKNLVSIGYLIPSNKKVFCPRCSEVKSIPLSRREGILLDEDLKYKNAEELMGQIEDALSERTIELYRRAILY